MSEEWSSARIERAERIISERKLHPLTDTAAVQHD